MLLGVCNTSLLCPLVSRDTKNSLPRYYSSIILLVASLVTPLVEDAQSNMVLCVFNLSGTKIRVIILSNCFMEEQIVSSLLGMARNKIALAFIKKNDFIKTEAVSF